MRSRRFLRVGFPLPLDDVVRPALFALHRRASSGAGAPAAAPVLELGLGLDSLALQREIDLCQSDSGDEGDEDPVTVPQQAQQAPPPPPAAQRPAPAHFQPSFMFADDAAVGSEAESAIWLAGGMLLQGRSQRSGGGST